MKKVISTTQAPAAIGPYVQAIEFDKLLFVSGQIPINPLNGELVLSDIKTQAQLVLTNLQAVLEAGGSNLESCIKTTIFLKDMADFPIVNEVYASFFENDPPARSCVAVAALPKGVSIEIDAIAYKK